MLQEEATFQEDALSYIYSRLWRTLPVIAVTSLTVTTSAFTVATDVGFITKNFLGGKSSGHEEINRQALKFTERALENGYDIDAEELFGDAFTELEAKIFGTKGHKSMNPIIMGNFSTDMPATGTNAILDGVTWAIDLRKYYNLPDSVDWHKNPSGQNMHFLRNHIVPDGNGVVPDAKARVQSAQAACYGSQNMILDATEEALKNWALKVAIENKTKTPEELELFRPSKKKKKKRKFMSRDEAADHYRNKALFFIGHATHILQDSFSPAHADRGLFDFNYELERGEPTYLTDQEILPSIGKSLSSAIQDVCYYPTQFFSGLVNSGSHFLKIATSSAQIVPTTNATLFYGDFKQKFNRKGRGEVCKHDTFDYDDSIWLRTSVQWRRADLYRWHIVSSQMRDEVNHNRSLGRKFWDRSYTKKLIRGAQDAVHAVSESTLGLIAGAPETDPSGDYDNGWVKMCDSNFFTTEKGKHRCVNHEARLARSATMKYLIAVARHLDAQEKAAKKSDVFDPKTEELKQNLIDNVFNGNAGIREYNLSEILPDGIFRCGDLSDEMGKVI